MLCINGHAHTHTNQEQTHTLPSETNGGTELTLSLIYTHTYREQASSNIIGVLTAEHINFKRDSPFNRVIKLSTSAM